MYYSAETLNLTFVWQLSRHQQLELYYIRKALLDFTSVLLVAFQPFIRPVNILSISSPISLVMLLVNISTWEFNIFSEYNEEKNTASTLLRKPFYIFKAF